MKKLLIAIHALFLISMVLPYAALADDQPEPYNMGAPYNDDYFTAEELEDLLAPIALYPDPLIAQILPAATFIDQIDEAARYIRLFGKTARIDRQPWDVSVKALAHYPDVLLMMDQKQDWTVSLGQAFVNQPEEVMYAIQRLRSHAMAAGNLVSTPQQQVVVEGDDIRIYPAEPQVIYVPVYDPQVVYVERPTPSYGLVTFGIGFTIGAWLNRDCDWHGRRVYYHGWQGRGWIERARPHVHVRNTVYVNNRYTVVNVNRRVVYRDTVRYREQIRRDVRVRRELPGRPTPPPRDHRIPVKTEPLRGRPTPPAVVQPRSGAPDHDRRPPAGIDNRDIKPGQPSGGPPRPVPPTRDPRPSGPGTSRDDKPAAAPIALPAAPKPAPQDVYRGRDTQKSQPASRSGYGGYGSGKDAGKYRERGAASQEQMRGSDRPARAGQPAPAQRPPAAGRPTGGAEKQSAPKPEAQPDRRQEAPAERGDKEQKQKR